MDRKDVVERAKSHIRNIPDFPKKGILFKDITTLLKEADLFKDVVELVASRYLEKGVQLVVGVEARGFIIGGAVAARLRAGFVPVRKEGKLPAETCKVTYALEYGTDTLEIHEDSILSGQRVVIIDDLLATGGTAAAAVQLIEKLKGEIVEVAFLIELLPLKGREKLKGYSLFSLIEYSE